MATTTTNFGWDIPQSTDLVKDGATAIAALGQDIDTAFVDFKGGTTGQVLKKTSGTDLDVEWGTASSGLTLINTTSFSGVASQAVNNVFSATYDNYKIVFNCIIATSDQGIFFRMRAGGVDTAGSSYFWAGNAREYTGSGATTGLGTIAGNATSNFYMTGASTSGYRMAIIDINNPFLARLTNYNTLGFNANSGFHVSGILSNTTSYDGFNILPAANNITGEVSVYGYNK